MSCQAPILDLFAEWTDEYQTKEGKRAILAGEIVFDCYYCRAALQLVLPLALIMPQKPLDQVCIAQRKRMRCEDWLRSQHPGQSLSQIVEMASWQHDGKWAFDGYNWAEGDIHAHGKDGIP